MTGANGATGGTARLTVEVDRAPRPGLLRAAIEARLAGRGWGGGPEAAVADAVARAVEAQRAEDGPWR